MLRRNNKKPVVNKSTGFFDDDDQEIFVGNILEHEHHYQIEVIVLTNGEFGGKVLNFTSKNLFVPIYSLNNGKGYTIIKK
jgi:hypothetical protein